MALLQTLNLAHLPPGLAVHIALYEDVKNAAFLQQQLLEGNPEFEYALVDASVILSSNHILAAVFRAANDMENGRLKSRNVHSEIVFALSPNNNIAHSFRTFGIIPMTKSLIVVKLSTDPSIIASSISQHLSTSIEGTNIPFDEKNISRLTDMGKVRKVYKLNEGKNPNKERRKKNNAETEVVNENEQTDDRKELEVVILGLMALRGLS